jgi:hypothetical protein
MRRASLKAPLEMEKVQHAPFSMDLFPAKMAGPAYAQLVAATEEPAGPMRR